MTTLGIEVGEVVADKYRIESVLGAGGMGVVFSARHTTLNGQFALKFLSREGLANTQAIGRFYREAQAAARLRSEHAVRVFDVGTHTNGLPYIVMEYLEGGDLGRLLRASGQLPVNEAVDYMLQTCVAIAEAHKAGIIHRDLKPSNLFCVPREDKSITIKVLDFGISKVVNALPNEEAVTVTGNFIGSPSYMSPEQMKAPNRVDSRTDIWSLGVVLYECLTAKLPFPAGSFPEICLRVAQDPPVLPSVYRGDLPPRLEAIILRCLEKDRDKRFANVKQLADALSGFTSTPAPRFGSSVFIASVSADIAPGSARLPTKTAASFGFAQNSWARTASFAKRRGAPLLLALGVGMLALIGIVLGVVLYDRQKLRAEVSAAVGTSSGVSGTSASASLAPLRAAAAESVAPPVVSAAPPVVSAAPPVVSAAPPVVSAAPRADVTPPPTSASLAPRVSVPPPVRNEVQVVPVPAASAAIKPTASPKKPTLAVTAKPLTERDSKSSTWKR